MIKPQLKEPADLIVDELCTPDGTARIDLALLNGRLAAFELKSDLDTVKRLPSQVAGLSTYFDELNLVLTRKHLEKASKIVPDCWGIMVAYSDGSRVRFETIRQPIDNPTRSIKHQLQFLWKDDLVALCRKFGLASMKPHRLGKSAICGILCETLPMPTLRNEFRSSLKARIATRLALPLASDDGRFQ